MSADWLTTASTWRIAHKKFVIVTILGVRGSAPAEAGRRMLVSLESTHGTIGGGKLEHEAIGAARSWLHGSAEQKQLTSLALGSKLGQCCGGKVVMHYEKVVPEASSIAIFGAGHVGQELATLLSRLPYAVSCHDTRPLWLDELDNSSVSVCAAKDNDDLLAGVGDLKQGAYCVVMTHSHALDLALARELLTAQRFSYVGVIGSASKAARFKRELSGRKLPLENFHCPIGDQAGKLPAEVAVMIAAELFKAIHANNHDGGISEKTAMRLLSVLTEEALKTTATTTKGD